MKLDSTIKAILFDIGWTLIYPNPTRREATEKFLSDLGYTFPPEILESANSSAMIYYCNNRWKPETMQNINPFWLEYYSVLLEHLSINDSDLPFTFYHHINKTVLYHLYPETLLVLKELRNRNYLIGAVSNWSIDLLNILEYLRLDEYLDTVVISDQIGYYKPQAEIFRYALNSIGVHATATIHIGDDLEADVEGARKVGIKPIWLKRDATNDFNNQSHQIQSLDELLVMPLN